MGVRRLSRFFRRESHPTITLSGDAAGSTTLTNLEDATMSITVANDSHTHDTRYYSESEVDGFLAAKSATGHTHSYLPLTGGAITGDLTVDTDVLYVDTTSNLIGINRSPQYVLDVSNDAVDGNILRLKGADDTLNFTVSAGDWSILNSQQSNGVVIYDGTGGVEIWYNGAAVFEADSGGVKVGGTAISVDGHTHSYLSTSGGSLSGNLSVSGYVSATNKFWGGGIAFDQYDNWSSDYSGSGGGAGIANDNGTYDALMIVGNNSAGGSRIVKVWDILDVQGTLRQSGTNVSLDGHTHSYAASSHSHSYVPTSGGTISGDLTVTGVIDVNEVRGDNGSTSDPSFTFTTDQDTGMYRNTTNSIGFTTGNAQRTVIHSNGDFWHYYQMLVPNMNATGSYNTVRWGVNGHLQRYTSTIEIKEDIVSIKPLMDYLNERSIIYDLRPVLFHQKDNEDGTNSTRGEYVTGMIAEEVLEVAPELCYYDHNGELTSWGIEAMIPHIVAELQRLAPMVESLYADANPDWVAPTPRPAERAAAERQLYDEAAAAQALVGLPDLSDPEGE